MLWRLTSADFSNLYPAEYFQLLEESKSPGRKGPAFTKFLNQYTANRKRWLQHGDSIVEQTRVKVQLGGSKKTTDQGPFYLHVEAFDPHEPWDPPTRFLEKYLKKPTRHSWPEPPYGDVKVPEEGARRLRANYAGEASNVDYWYTRVIETVKSLGLYDNTVILFLPEHGALLNEQGQWVEGPEKIRKQVTHVPLLIHTPKNTSCREKRYGDSATASMVPTILESDGNGSTASRGRICGHS